jgi:hypothetical protein
MRNFQIVTLVGTAIVNGIFSPLLITVFALHGLWYPFFLPASIPLVFMLSSLILSTLTLMLGGVPAALYERFATGGRTTEGSGFLWLAGVLGLTLPALPSVFKALGFV